MVVRMGAWPMVRRRVRKREEEKKKDVGLWD